MTIRIRARLSAVPSSAEPGRAATAAVGRLFQRLKPHLLTVLSACLKACPDTNPEGANKIVLLAFHVPVLPTHAAEIRQSTIVNGLCVSVAKGSKITSSSA
jgi:hypothetical protein